MGANLKVGDTVWMFGRGDTPEVFRVVSETSRSWVLSDGQKVPKHFKGDVFEAQGGMALARFCLTKDAADALLLERSRWAMSARIGDCRDTATLRAVAAALGMPTGVEVP